MALFPNGRYATTYRGRQFGPGLGLEIIARDDTSRLAIHQLSQTVSVPEGYGRPAVVLPRVSGAMSAKVSGSGALSPDAMLAADALATLVGAGGIEALGGLIVSLAATISGSGTVSSATLQAFLDMVATLTGSGGLTGDRSALGDMSATVTGSGTAATSTATGLGGMEATLRGYGDLTPEGIRDAVWQALLSQYTSPGSAGNALSTASSGGVDLNLLAAAVWAYASRSLPAAERDAIAAALLAAAQAAPIDANIKQVNDVTVNGTGAVGDEWGP